MWTAGPGGLTAPGSRAVRHPKAVPGDSPASLLILAGVLSQVNRPEHPQLQSRLGTWPQKELDAHSPSSSHRHCHHSWLQGWRLGSLLHCEMGLHGGAAVCLAPSVSCQACHTRSSMREGLWKRQPQVVPVAPSVPAVSSAHAGVHRQDPAPLATSCLGPT